jgi:hypothetical protein
MIMKFRLLVVVLLCIASQMKSMDVMDVEEKVLGELTKLYEAIKEDDVAYLKQLCEQDPDLLRYHGFVLSAVAKKSKK